MLRRISHPLTHPFMALYVSSTGMLRRIVDLREFGRWVRHTRRTRRVERSKRVLLRFCVLIRAWAQRRVAVRRDRAAQVSRVGPPGYAPPPLYLLTSRHTNRPSTVPPRPSRSSCVWRGPQPSWRA